MKSGPPAAEACLHRNRPGLDAPGGPGRGERSWLTLVRMKRHPRAFWAGLVAEVEAGAAIVEVARRHKVRESTLRWWRTQLRRAAPGPRLVPVLGQVSVHGPTPVRPSRHVELAISGAVLRFEEGTDVEYVVALARAVSAAC